VKYWKSTFTALLLILSGLLLAVFQFPDNNLHIIACNVGQGDAILVTLGNTQILTDGGPDKSVVDCLGKFMPFWDREIELVISTHPDSDHSTGLVTVLQGYKVDKILINPIDPGTHVYKALVSEVGGRGVAVINPVSGMQLGVGLIHLDILNPTADLFDGLDTTNGGDKLSKYEDVKDTNLYSIVYRLSFKNFSGIFAGDAQPKVLNNLAAEYPNLHAEYIKIPHHGSVNGLTEDFLKAVMPKIALISVGKNQWGFPKPEILEMLGKYNVETLRTDTKGDIELVSDGEGYWVK